MPKLIAGHTLINYDENVSRVVIPKFVFAIADRAFSERGQIKAIEMGESVKNIGNYAFRMCYNMKEIILPQTVDEFGEGVFENCWALERVSLPEGTKIVDDEMFVDCNSLIEIFLPNSIETVDDNAFRKVPKLTTLHIGPDKLGVLPLDIRDIAVLSYMEKHNSDDGSQEKLKEAELIHKYIDEHGERLTRRAITDSRTLAIRYMVRRDLVKPAFIGELVEIAASQRSSEIVALLIDEQNKIRREEPEQTEAAWDPFA